jgi:hypothetical protein
VSKVWWVISGSVGSRRDVDGRTARRRGGAAVPMVTSRSCESAE